MLGVFGWFVAVRAWAADLASAKGDGIIGEREDAPLRVPLTEAVLEVSVEDTSWSVAGTVRDVGLTAEPNMTQDGQGDVRLDIPLQLTALSEGDIQKTKLANS